MNKNASKLILCLLALLVLPLVACSDDDDSDREVFTIFSYNLESNANWYRVNEWHAYYDGNRTYTVKNYIIHWFSKSNSKYRGLSGDELCDLAESRTDQPISKTKYVEEGDFTYEITYDDGTITKMNTSDGTVYEEWNYQ